LKKKKKEKYIPQPLDLEISHIHTPHQITFKDIISNNNEALILSFRNLSMDEKKV